MEEPVTLVYQWPAESLAVSQSPPLAGLVVEAASLGVWTGVGNMPIIRPTHLCMAEWSLAFIVEGVLVPYTSFEIVSGCFSALVIS